MIDIMRRLLFILCFLLFSLPAFSQKQPLDSLIAEIPKLSEKNYRQHLLLVYQYLSEQEQGNLLPISEKIIETGRKSPIPAVYIYAKVQVARVLNYKNITEGVNVALEAYWAAKSQNLLFETAEAAKLLAYVFNMAEKNEKTLQYALEASDAYQKIGTEHEKVRLYYEIALVQYRLQNYQSALDYLLRLEGTQVDSLGKQEQINYFNTIALCYTRLKNYPQSFAYLNKSLEKAKKFKKNEWVGIILGNKGDIFFEKKQIDSARYYWQIDLETSKKYKIWENVVSTLNYFGKSYEEEKDYQKAYAYFKEAHELFPKIAPTEYANKYNTYKGLANTLQHLDSLQLAYEYLQKAYLMEDSLQEIKQNNQVLQVQFEYWLKNQELSYSFKRKNNEKQIFIAKIGIALLLLGAGILAYFLWKQHKLNKLIKIQKASLKEKNEEIARQNEELLEKQEEVLQQKNIIVEKSNEQEQLIKRLKHSEEFLSEALDKLIADEALINEKNRELENYSKNLEQEVAIRTQELSEKNKELVNTINQLEQFSYVLAHNVRSPVARLQGLMNCLDRNDLNTAENKKILNYIHQSALDLDTIIKDLNKVLEIKKGINEIYEKIDLKKKIEKQRTLLYEAKAELYIDLRVRYVYAIKAYVNSILYNLISNAIKYKNPDRKLVVTIRSYQDDDLLYLEVEDNGIGIDLEKHQHKIFGIYKRFHATIEGKGLGLHIVKLQVEAMGGKIEVSSKVNEGTIFKMTFKKPPDVVEKIENN